MLKKNSDFPDLELGNQDLARASRLSARSRHGNVSVFLFGLENSTFFVRGGFFFRKALINFFKFFRHENSKKMFNRILEFSTSFSQMDNSDLHAVMHAC